ncbi:RNA polymerase sigma-70 factor, ECF subfamily [Chitinophaga terrae (ex Kim and Jung 2007)]|uniref:RNA polymerase sigma-70 factor, ECF subfamily n=1 Tax=Chitinophaga terrae (ex Kim and Jung 2007) TaxID=408074 RepID=A0A1H4BSP2_9BACT|nr:sigma-70 family RNA polymerase sigma factor [Chitinophaga terrae (ex Kim and Jung 2007)]GEP89756.1 DNA-directed RNA polymerase sigma-70 factor [Chitinophaga terrae (ex Kim and Jung 2007)]SEA51186.1 RNA polymerase sigma-70 factor, ECF subfamily [Chitinophaga terrae (ex Kim and Jung 2007)]
MSDYHIYTDHDLLLLIRQDDARAFTEIYHRYWKRMFTLALHRLNSRQAAEDIVQDVFSGLWQRRHESEITTLGAYLAVATRYAAFRQLAKMKSTTDTDTLPETIQASADDTTAARFLLQSMQEELRQLPEKCRLVFDYSRNKGWSNREISQQLQISEKAVEKHITKALQRLRIQLKHYLHSLF